MDRKNIFRMPIPMKITGRSSTITAAFVSAIIPAIEPTDDEILEALEILGMDEHNVRCAYCGDPMTEWDHLRPLVSQQKPTGFITEIGNLVPSCGKCNQSKGNKPWREWMLGNAGRSPRARGVADISERVKRLDAYERWRSNDPKNFERMVPADIWAQHWANWQAVCALLSESQKTAAKVRAAIEEQA